MPDRDKLHEGLPGPYLDAYEDLCRGKPSSTIRRSLEKGIRDSIQYFGDGPVRAIEKITDVIEVVGPLFDSPDTLQELGWEIDSIAYEMIDDPRAAEMVRRSASRASRKVRSGSIDHAELTEEAFTLYAQEVLRTGFSDRLYNKESHEHGATEAVLRDRMDEVQADLPKVFRHFGRQLADQGKTASIRMSPAVKEPVDLDENLNEL